MFDLMALCNACGQKELGRTSGNGASTCEGCWRLTDSPKARFCEVCASRKNCCKFCAADLRTEFAEAEPAPEMQPLPTAILLGKTSIPPVPMWIIDTILMILALAFVNASFHFLYLRS
jgi:hypothetical protein